MIPLRESNIEILESKSYGVEERLDNKIDLYSPKFLFIDQFNSHEELSEWIKKNIN